MSSPWIEAVRSVALNVPDLAQAETFYTEVWRLSVAHRGEQAICLRGTGSDHHLLALHAGGPVPQIRQVTLRARSLDALHAVAEAVPRAGGTLLSPIGPLRDDPAGGTGLTLRDPHGRVIQVVHGDARGEDTGPQRDQPARLTHVVLNSHAVDDTQRFLTEALGFTLADRTVAIAFMNCNHDHHTLAVGVADNDALNHIAFLMPDADSVMRGGGRMKDAGHPIEWGPGRHGPGNNLFNYFIDPFGIVIEYTAEVEQVDDSYVPRGPAEWKWPPGRVDQWGISPPPGATLKEAQRRVLFAPMP
ncbi:VOC family protein [Hydrogenophaga sp. UC242_53]|jgi:catechol-2,3-dioxygenase|uniref:VOC family protein n=1 Tax=Hydrogenophaga sp. UC242_53 TaxID=3350170 RepID=UPI0036D3CF12